MNDYQRIGLAIDFLENHRSEQPSLKALADHVRLSPFHLQRLFKRWAGISPKQFLQFNTLQIAKRLLRDSESVLGASFDSGLSGPGRMHDLFVTFDAVTPGTFKTLGSGMEIRYGFHESPFGICFIAVTDKGICALSFPDRINTDSVDELKANWPAASIIKDQDGTGGFIEQIFAVEPDNNKPFHLLIRGTNFQIKVWEALIRIPPGRVISYDRIAGLIGNPKASRAVGNAVGANPISYLIPCHRVIRKSGAFGNYHWGAERKKAILVREQFTADPIYERF